MRPSLFHSSRRVAGQRGFSLVELMIAVVIIGVLASAAAVAMSPDPDVEDEAQKVAAIVNEVARLAISGGPIDPSASITGLTARGRLQVLDDGQGGQFLLLERYNDQAGFDDIDRKRVALGRRVRIVSFFPGAALSPGGMRIPISAAGLAIGCRPDGTCTLGGETEPPTGATLYLQDTRRPDRRARVVVLPLNGMMTQVFSGW